MHDMNPYFAVTVVVFAVYVVTALIGSREREAAATQSIGTLRRRLRGWLHKAYSRRHVS
jgi:hypothetical protein